MDRLHFIHYTVPIYSKDGILTNWKWLCFKHAIMRAMKGEYIETEVKSYQSYSCSDCN